MATTRAAGEPSSGGVVRRLLGSPAFLFVLVSVVQKGIGFLLLPFFAAALQPEGYGQVSLLVTVSAALTTIVSLGLEMAVFRSVFTSDRRERSRETATLTTLLLVFPPLATALLAALVIGADIDGLPVGNGPVALSVMAAGLTVAATTAPLAVLRATSRVGSYVRLSLLVTALTTGAKVVGVVVLQEGVWGWAVADVVSAALALIISLRWQARHLTGRPRAADAEQGLRYGLPLVPHQVAHWGLSLADRLVLGALVGASAVGVYSVGYQIALVAQMVVTELSRASMPAYGEVARGDRDWPALRAVVGRKILASSVVCGLVAMWGGAVVSVVLPPGYEGARSYVPWVCLGAFFISLYYVPMNLLSLVAGKTGSVWAASAIAALTNVLMNLALIPRFGAIAAAVNTAVGYGVLLALLSLLARRQLAMLGRPSRQVMLDVGLVSLVSLVAVLVGTGRGAPVELLAPATGTAIVLGIVARRYSSHRPVDVRRGL